MPVKADESQNMYAYGGLWSSAEDISRWDIALAGSVLVKDPAHRDIIYKPAKLKMVLSYQQWLDGSLPIIPDSWK